MRSRPIRSLLIAFTRLKPAPSDFVVRQVTGKQAERAIQRTRPASVREGAGTRPCHAQLDGPHVRQDIGFVVGAS
jgi:hypothetical protein